MAKSSFEPRGGGGDRLPPQNIEAEEEILGGIFLDPEALPRVSEVLRPEAFYITAYQDIYRAALALHAQGRPTDLTSVSAWLEDYDLLDKVGGTAALRRLVEQTVSSINVDQYARLVLDKYTRRQLIRASNQTAELAYDASLEIPQVMDRIEQNIFEITQERVQRSLVPASDVLLNIFSELEDKFQSGNSLPGIPTGFYDLDNMTQGLQRSDLVVVAGRPSMGKCLTGDAELVQTDGRVITIAEMYRRRQAEVMTLNEAWRFEVAHPSAFVDDGIKPVFQLVTRSGRQLTCTAPHPLRTLRGWKPLADLKPGDAIAVPRCLPMFGTVQWPESRVKLLSYWLSGARLTESGLALLSDNAVLHADCDRAQLEDSDWFSGIAARQVDGKAAEFPIIPAEVFALVRSLLALFLNRLLAVTARIEVVTEARTRITCHISNEKLARQIQHVLLRFGILSELERRAVAQLSISEPRSLKTLIDDIGMLGREDALTEICELLSHGQQEFDADCIPGDIWQEIEGAKGAEPWQSLTQRAGLENDCQIDDNCRPVLTRDRLLQLAIALEDSALQALATSDVYWDEIIEIAPAGLQQVYDLTIPETHNFVANDICVHNTAICINIAHNIAANSKFPVAIFSLEMSREQLVQRLLSGEARIEANRLRSGRISENEWQRLSQAIGHLAQLPIYIDDTPNCTVTEIRSKTRRLQAEVGGNLGMVLLDYLQLMDGAGSENRVLELARITRGLKGLAKELNAPVVILSQLSRAVESRQDKHPQLSDLRESGCLVADTQLVDADTGKIWTIAQLANSLQYPRLWSWNERDRLVPQRPQRVFYSGHKPVFELATNGNKLTIQATGNHPFLTRDRGWQALDALRLGEAIAIARAGVLTWETVETISPCGSADVYDIAMPEHHNFVANDFVVHNSIEQDADLVLMLYRPEYYDPNTVDKGLAEVVIAKHRNGPTGIVKLLFENQYTQFRNLATPSG